MVRPFKQDDSPRPVRVAPQRVQPTQRLHKLLALAGLGSRRDMEELIASGRVMVNGVVAQVGAGVTPDDVVKLDRRILRLPFEAELPRVLLYHKPEGEIVSQDDPENRATVFDKLPKVANGRWVAVGRLDINTSGLLIFTTSGELANHFMHPRYEVERVYAVRLMGELTEGQMLQLKEGVALEDGMAQFDSIQDKGGEGANHWYEVMLKEGRNREVRRLFDALGMMVSRLMRVRFGPVDLPSRLKRGQMMELPQREVAAMLEWAGLEVSRSAQRPQKETDSLGKTFTPKERKPVSRKLTPAAAKPKAPVKKTPTGPRRIHGDNMSPPKQQRRSDRDRGRG